MKLKLKRNGELNIPKERVDHIVKVYKNFIDSQYLKAADSTITQNQAVKHMAQYVNNNQELVFISQMVFNSFNN